MKTEVFFKTKLNRSEGFNQTTIVELTTAKIIVEIKEIECRLIILTDNYEAVQEYFYIVWELLALYDGYFYKPYRLLQDGIEKGVEPLYRTKFYHSDDKWVQGAVSLGKNERELTKEIFENYMVLRSKGRREASMNKSMVNAYFTLMSESYKDINIEHRIVLLMHLCDGLAIAYHNGNPKNNSGNICKIIEILGKSKFKEGAALLGVDSNKAVDALINMRNQLTHYNYDSQKLSLGDYIVNSDKETDNKIYLYAFYVLELAFRVGILDAIGYKVSAGIKDDAMDDLLRWIKRSI